MFFFQFRYKFFHSIGILLQIGVSMVNKQFDLHGFTAKGFNILFCAIFFINFHQLTFRLQLIGFIKDDNIILFWSSEKKNWLQIVVGKINYIHNIKKEIGRYVSKKSKQTRNLRQAMSNRRITSACRARVRWGAVAPLLFERNNRIFFSKS